MDILWTGTRPRRVDEPGTGAVPAPGTSGAPLGPGAQISLRLGRRGRLDRLRRPPWLSTRCDRMRRRARRTARCDGMRRRARVLHRLDLDPGWTVARRIANHEDGLGRR